MGSHKTWAVPRIQVEHRISFFLAFLDATVYHQCAALSWPWHMVAFHSSSLASTLQSNQNASSRLWPWGMARAGGGPVFVFLYGWSVTSLAGLWCSLCRGTRMNRPIWLFIVMTEQRWQRTEATQFCTAPEWLGYYRMSLQKRLYSCRPGCCRRGWKQQKNERRLDHYKCWSTDICCGGGILYAGLELAVIRENKLNQAFNCCLCNCLLPFISALQHLHKWDI